MFYVYLHFDPARSGGADACNLTRRLAPAIYFRARDFTTDFNGGRGLIIEYVAGCNEDFNSIQFLPRRHGDPIGGRPTTAFRIADQTSSRLRILPCRDPPIIVGLLCRSPGTKAAQTERRPPQHALAWDPAGSRGFLLTSKLEYIETTHRLQMPKSVPLRHALQDGKRIWKKSGWLTARADVGGKIGKKVGACEIILRKKRAHYYY